MPSYKDSTFFNSILTRDELQPNAQPIIGMGAVIESFKRVQEQSVIARRGVLLLSGLLSQDYGGSSDKSKKRARDAHHDAQAFIIAAGALAHSLPSLVLIAECTITRGPVSSTCHRHPKLTSITGSRASSRAIRLGRDQC